MGEVATGSHVGPYEVLGDLGSGGMGEVYRARDTRIGREVALKVLPREVQEDAACLHRFRDEARTVGTLNHPNIVTLYEVGEHGGAPYLVTELLAGQTLQARLGRGALAPPVAVRIAREVALGLAAAHAKGIVHRDLKPANLFLTEDGRVKLLDLGIAQQVGSRPRGSADATVTASGTVVGTVAYMAPEQIRGERVDSRADIFALGLILHEMLAGRRPFKGSSELELAAAILRDDPPVLPDPVLEGLVRRCLAKAPGDRFQSAQDLAYALETFSASPVVGRLRPRRRLLLATAAAVAIGAAGLAAGLFYGRETAQGSRPVPRFTRLTFTGDVGAGRFQHDQQSFLFTRRRGDIPSIELGRIGTDDTRPLIDSAVFLDVSPTDELLIKKRPDYPHALLGSPGTISRVSLAGGSPREIASDVTWASWTADGKEIAAMRDLQETTALEYPLGTTLYSSPLIGGSFSISEAGDRIALVEREPLDHGGASLVILDLHGTKRTLTRAFDAMGGVNWAPDGKSIYFSASEKGSKLGIWEVTLTGRERALVSTFDGMLLNDVARDGRLLVNRFTSTQRVAAHRRTDDLEHDLSGLASAHLTDISEDGEWVAIENSDPSPGPEYKSYLRRTDGTSPILLGEGTCPRLSLDGKYVVTGSIVSPERIRIIPTGAGRTRELPAHGLKERRQPMWMPDGRSIVYSGLDARGGRRLHVQDVEGGLPRAFGPEGTTLERYSG
ncbi:MAG TPA: protein kinase, partial [Myxococcaceae bacterium]|nr:protein kinase [Myxococcaceae bacterium]